jgi:hypothetical protein
MTPTVHVVPLRDAIDHEVPGGLDGQEGGPGPWLMFEADSDDIGGCLCGPTVEVVPIEIHAGPAGHLKPAGSMAGQVVTHHSLDGREAFE